MDLRPPGLVATVGDSRRLSGEAGPGRSRIAGPGVTPPMDLSLGRRGGLRGASLAALLLVGGALSCFTGDLLAQQPCERDDGTPLARTIGTASGS
jgi:hypothetical protein